MSGSGWEGGEELGGVEGGKYNMRKQDLFSVVGEIWPPGFGLDMN